MASMTSYECRLYNQCSPQVYNDIYIYIYIYIKSTCFTDTYTLAGQWLKRAHPSKRTSLGNSWFPGASR